MRNKKFDASLRKSFRDKDIIPNGSPTKGFEFALQGTKLFLQRTTHAISVRIPQVTDEHQSDLHDLLNM